MLSNGRWQSLPAGPLTGKPALPGARQVLMSERYYCKHRFNISAE
ncbi:hypothetical protein HMPREF1144_2048 [Klebsiella sp. OBRC7]|nr:hypothetical protein HMPREF1144_2048 [Klebsiella sp. OBRC7]